MQKKEIIAYVLCGHDNDAYGLPCSLNSEYCRFCGGVINRGYKIKDLKLKKNYDVSSTYDGYKIVSDKFRNLCNDLNLTGIDFHKIDGCDGFHSITSRNVVRYDANRRRTRFERFNECCSRYDAVAGATPAFLLDADALINGLTIYRTDIEFGSGRERHPLLIFPLLLNEARKKVKISGLELSPVYK